MFVLERRTNRDIFLTGCRIFLQEFSHFLSRMTLQQRSCQFWIFEQLQHPVELFLVAFPSCQYGHQDYAYIQCSLRISHLTELHWMFQRCNRKPLSYRKLRVCVRYGKWDVRIDAGRKFLFPCENTVDKIAARISMLY